MEQTEEMKATEGAPPFLSIPHRAEWIAALRSGEYKQGRGKLHRADENAYCCLGVWAKIAGHEISDDAYDDLVVNGSNVGYDPIDKAFGGYKVRHLFAGMNDSLEFSFDKIADFLEGKGPSVAEVEQRIFGL